MKEQLLEKLKEAMRNKDEVLKDTISMLRAAIKQIEVDERREVEDSEIKILVSKEVKKRNEAKKEFQNADRLDLVEKLDKEIEILSEYLPKQLSKEEIVSIIEQVIKDTNANSPKDMGKVMKEIMPKTKGAADGKLVSDLVKEMLI